MKSTVWERDVSFENQKYIYQSETMNNAMGIHFKNMMQPHPYNFHITIFQLQYIITPNQPLCIENKMYRNDYLDMPGLSLDMFDISDKHVKLE